MIYFFENGANKFTCYAESEEEAWVKLAKAINNKTDNWRFIMRIHLKNFYLLYNDK